jgi:hypothetical protein
MELTIDRETAFRIVEGTTQTQTDPVTGRLHEPELLTLERQRPDQAALTKMIRLYLEGQVKHCAKRRKDHEAIAGLIDALLMAARLLTSLEIKEGECGGPVSSVRRTFLSLADTLASGDVVRQFIHEYAGEKDLPEPQSMRPVAAEGAAS